MGSIVYMFPCKSGTLRTHPTFPHHSTQSFMRINWMQKTRIDTWAVQTVDESRHFFTGAETVVMIPWFTATCELIPPPLTPPHTDLCPHPHPPCESSKRGNARFAEKHRFFNKLSSFLNICITELSTLFKTKSNPVLLFLLLLYLVIQLFLDS